MTENRKPFGLTLACKVTAEAIRESVAPVSVILYNLLFLQKDTSFPKNLDTQFFATKRNTVSEQDKKDVAKILDKLRSPHASTSELLEGIIKDEWVIKKAPPRDIPITKELIKKVYPKNNIHKKTRVQKETIVPVVIVKKHKTI